MASQTDFDLSQPAKIDLQEIFDYSYEQFGAQRAINYFASIMGRFELLVKFPNSGLQRDDIRKGLKSSVIESHIIFYRIRKSRVFIVRILHQSRDVEHHLK